MPITARGQFIAGQFIAGTVHRHPFHRRGNFIVKAISSPLSKKGRFIAWAFKCCGVYWFRQIALSGLIAIATFYS